MRPRSLTLLLTRTRFLLTSSSDRALGPCSFLQHSSAADAHTIHTTSQYRPGSFTSANAILTSGLVTTALHHFKLPPPLASRFHHYKTVAAPKPAAARKPTKVVVATTTPSAPQCQVTYNDIVCWSNQRMAGELAPSPPEDREFISDLMKAFSRSRTAKDKAREFFVHAELYPKAVGAFRRLMQRAIQPPLVRQLAECGPAYGHGHEALLLAWLRPFAEKEYAAEVASYQQQVRMMDLRQPHTWYPFARALKRKIIYHAGPTNSGKTYNALQALKAAEKGVYCGPLRLLAMEVYDTLNHQGVTCNLLTGQEKQQVPGAEHTSCTVEMVGFHTRLDVGVIDEIQMLGDEQRGWAWTRALLGLPASEVHVCGDLSAIALVRQLAAVCGDEFEVQQYHRFTPLKVQDPKDALPNGIADISPGDCVVAFSRMALYRLKTQIEQRTTNKVCIVYGALPPETRKHQAQLFNDPSSGYRVLVASDAVGLGLNFNIRRVVFATLKKRLRSSPQMVFIPETLIKQIGGRAGRRNSAFPEGIVTCLNKGELGRLRHAMALPNDALKTPAAGLFPEFEQIELLAGQLPSLSFHELMERFASGSQLDSQLYFFANQESLVHVAKLLDKVPELSLADRYKFSMAPVSSNDALVDAALLEFAKVYARGDPVRFNMSRMPKQPPQSDKDMQYMESVHKVISLWLWLSLRFEEHYFPAREAISALNKRLITWMNQRLAITEATAPETSEEQSSSRGSSSKPRQAKGAVVDIMGYRMPESSASPMKDLLLEPIWDSSMAPFVYRRPVKVDAGRALAVG